MLDYINNDKSITIGVRDVQAETIQGDKSTSIEWEPLDQIKTYNMGFRQAFDRLFNTNTVRDNSERDVGSKQGCLYVGLVDGKEVQNGNSTLADAFRNKTFVEKYWNDKLVQKGLTEVCEDAYKDVDRNSEYSISASLNAYYNLTSDGKSGQDSYYNPTDVLTREQFYTMLLKATTPYYEIEDSSNFEKAIGTDSEYLKYASQVAKYGFLPYENKSLDANTISGSITKAEVIYMLVQMYFPELYGQATDKSPNYTDVPAGGDIAVNIGFKEVQKGDGDKPDQLVEKDRWQTYTLAYMLSNPDKGAQSELYRALAVAKQVGIIPGSTSGWDTSVNKHTAIVLIVNTLLAKNNIDGYLTETEYAEMFNSNTNTEEVDTDNESGVTTDDLFGNNTENENTEEDKNSTEDGAVTEENGDETASDSNIDETNSTDNKDTGTEEVDNIDESAIDNSKPAEGSVE